MTLDINLMPSEWSLWLCFARDVGCASRGFLCESSCESLPMQTIVNQSFEKGWPFGLLGCQGTYLIIFKCLDVWLNPSQTATGAGLTTLTVALGETPAKLQLPEQCWGGNCREKPRLSKGTIGDFSRLRAEKLLMKGFTRLVQLRWWFLLCLQHHLCYVVLVHNAPLENVIRVETKMTTSIIITLYKVAWGYKSFSMPSICYNNEEGN